MKMLCHIKKIEQRRISKLLLGKIGFWAAKYSNVNVIKNE